MDDKTVLNLGDNVRCKVTGFIGTVVAVTHWLSKVTRYGVQGPKMKVEDGRPSDLEWFDEGMLEKAS